MALKFNSDAKKQRTQQAFDCALAEIESNLSNGQKTTDLWIDKEVALDVRDMLDQEFKNQGMENNFYWAIVRRSPNPYTGAMQSFSGETIGDEKHYKLCYRE